MLIERDLTLCIEAKDIKKLIFIIRNIIIKIIIKTRGLLWLLQQINCLHRHQALNNIKFNDLSGTSQSVLQYSMGQLDSEEGAKEEAKDILFCKLSKQIVEILEHVDISKN